MLGFKLIHVSLRGIRQRRLTNGGIAIGQYPGLKYMILNNIYCPLYMPIISQKLSNTRLDEKLLCMRILSAMCICEPKFDLNNLVIVDKEDLKILQRILDMSH